MRNASLLLALAIVVPAKVVEAQELVGSVSGGPALVWNLGSRDSAWLIDGGAELRGDLFGVGAEVRYLHFPDSPAFGVPALALKGSYYPARDSDARLRPFLTAGLTTLFDEEFPITLLQAGGGVDWWTTWRAGFRCEVRLEGPAILAVRFGVVFR